MLTFYDRSAGYRQSAGAANKLGAKTVMPKTVIFRGRATMRTCVAVSRSGTSSGLGVTAVVFRSVNINQLGNKEAVMA
jgi:hypothetical protein